MHTIHILTVSDRVSAGTAEDTAGPAVRALVAEGLPGWPVRHAVVPDGVRPVSAAVAEACALGARVVLTLGGTGVGPRDRTPEAVDQLITRDLPGIPEMLRRAGQEQTPTAVLSRGRAGVVDPGDPEAHRPAVVVTLPGSRRAAEQAVPLLAPLLPHLVDQLDGGDHVRH
ncbi:MogA/MoaB family molybdenum cofactor biosynthesis protein [Citricoccus sp. SGAir0253]|uniref:MogA/MoaB family molybdenum cofactor biosynthesis protein n=1 Tax=Citricoccus sp. SGAir0253 TaxID=2567881 RepID=UPI0010CD5052|nr:MogA/MoaB family molybdenum cofactor biosynthesis protein [Citricoccus sp. SGAir0253]QCU78291.1 MogA/MoaB family molybdenum cofactor biosynthesis protein [Citricoccus sp. SGAir0253]